MFSDSPSVRPSVCLKRLSPKVSEHDILSISWKNFAEYTILVHLRTTINFFDFD